MKRLGVLIASTGVALTLGTVSATAGSYREEVYASPVRERVIVERPVERVTVRKIGLPRAAVFEDDGPPFPKWGRVGWRHHGWGGDWDHPW